jgi:hypothetical protein
MTSFQPKQEFNDDYENDSGSENEFSNEASNGINVIIKNYTDSAKSNNKSMFNNGLRRRKVPSLKSVEEEEKQDLTNSIYVQRELDLQEMQKLKNKIKLLQKTIIEEEHKNHFLKLDLCNAQVDNTELKKVLCIRETRIKYLEEQEKSYMWLVNNLKLLICILVILFICKFLF